MLEAVKSKRTTACRPASLNPLALLEDHVPYFVMGWSCLQSLRAIMCTLLYCIDPDGPLLAPEGSEAFEGTRFVLRGHGSKYKGFRLRDTIEECATHSHRMILELPRHHLPTKPPLVAIHTTCCSTTPACTWPYPAIKGCEALTKHSSSFAVRCDRPSRSRSTMEPEDENCNRQGGAYVPVQTKGRGTIVKLDFSSIPKAAMFHRCLRSNTRQNLGNFVRRKPFRRNRRT